MAKGPAGVQMNVHPKFLELFKDMQDDRIKHGKERSKELSHKRLSLTIYKLFKQDKRIYDTIITAEIDKNEV